MQSIVPRHDKPAAIRTDLGAIFVSLEFYLSESLTKSVQQSCCCCEGHAASRSTICWMALSAR